jgi:hypothetical protein
MLQARLHRPFEILQRQLRHLQPISKEATTSLSHPQTPALFQQQFLETQTSFRYIFQCIESVRLL